MLTYQVAARRVDAHSSLALTKQASIGLDTDPAGREDAFNPAELMLAALAACILKSIERVAPMLRFEFSGAEVSITANRQDSPPKLVDIVYELVVATDETDHRLDLLHTNVRKFGTISNTLSQATNLSGSIRRKP
jgi:uncharacterized OsmC-like protein